MVISDINLPLKGSLDPEKNLNIDAQLQTFLYAIAPNRTIENYTANSVTRYHKLRNSKV